VTLVSDAAHVYLSAGLSVIALIGKQPNAVWHPRGLHSAMSGVSEGEADDALIERVFADPNTTGIGIVIAFPYLVIDVDGEAGARAWADMLGSTQVDEKAPVARTGRGLHLWFSDWVPRRNRRLAEQLDLKGVGGYVVAPPSLHPDTGQRYEWLRPLVDEESGMINPPIEMPDVLRTRLATIEHVESDFGVERSQKGWPVLLLDNGVLRVGVEPARIDGLAIWMARQPKGNRNPGLFWAASVARDEGFTQKEALDVLGDAARQAGLDAAEARKTIVSAYGRR